jgi:uncharacterized protein (TIGR03032 family)
LLLPWRRPCELVPRELTEVPLTAAPSPNPGFFLASPEFSPWLAAQGVSLAVTTYQHGKLFLIGLDGQGRLAVHGRSYGRAVGLAGDDQTLWLGTLYQLWRLQNVGSGAGPHDRTYAPRQSFVTGAVNAHDIGLDAEGTPVFVNTLFSCLARPSARASFEPMWRPPFVSELAPEDRCHLNGLAMRDGRAAFVTACAVADTAAGWRERRRDGGLLLDVDTGEAAATGLSMPHSPRWREGRVWLLNSGTGEVGVADGGRFRPLAFCRGFTRGLAIWNGHAIIGLSRPTRGRTFEGLALQGLLGRESAECGLDLIDLATGARTAWFRFTDLIDEIYDVVVLPGVRRPAAVGLTTNEIERVLNIGAPAATGR